MGSETKTGVPEVQTTRPPRLEALDTLRFAAAVTVVIGHSNVIFRSFVAPWPLLGLTNSYSAVALFFVLSGYVLHQSCKRHAMDGVNYVAFIIKRVFRLYPLHFVALILGAAALQLPLHDSPLLMASEYARETILNKNHRQVAQWLQQLLLMGGGMDSTFVNPPIWTLAVEMRVSLLLPFLSLFAVRIGLRLTFVVTVLSLLLGPWLARITLPTMGMVPLFLLGILVAEVTDSQAAVRRGNGWMFSLGVLVYSLGEWTKGPMVDRLDAFYVAGVGAALMILATVRSKRIAKVLSYPLLVQLGQCSYGIYLLHFPLMLLTVWAINQLHMPPLALIPALLLATLFVARALFVIVEKPFIRFGHRLSARLVAERRSDR